MKHKSDFETTSEDIVFDKNGKATKKSETFIGKLKKWWMVPVLIVLLIAVVIFIKSGDEDDLYKAHYAGSLNQVIIGDTTYQILSKSSEESYIGSSVSDMLNVVKKDKVASLRSYLLYVAVFYSVEGDENLDYVVDGKNNVYIKEELFKDADSYYKEESNYNQFKITTRKKDLDTMVVVTDDQMQMLDGLDGKEEAFDNKKLTENYETRREIFGFYNNGIGYRAVMELFKYNDCIYKTTLFVDSDDNDGTTVLKGIKLPEEYQKQFLENWDK